MTDLQPQTKGQPSLGEAALFGLCPRCGAKTLFAGPVRFAERCRACALDYANFNVGDGPAAFLTLLIGGLITGLALWLQVAVAPPFWVHIILWVPLTVAAVLLGLRAAKSALLYMEYARGAREAGGKDLRDE
ncbi:hypothetical protein NT2_01_04390 [Caenibius tardaugens NBRC 16725]|uniref:DUF983 domain-containing protein n=1 Tax=Caenibius tardaugens NBRC 16725 TaxID=1219035 RepID=U2ZYR9_9SPHN|nr:DUF983 domain-containing protein [Caenibius tardaugens]AZI37096.1 DUF983 domain-containing protein [Caenibius tardaugens NBRC 16725]GAD47668.1 hypothetical protein NT2_01_04390 [Caenibius tardaugens NBRC 16725]